MSSQKILLEIPVFSVSDAINAVTFGADRLELCTSYLEGGLTPGPGLFRFIKEKESVPVFVMIRPRAGDFFYSSEDIDVMKMEIDLFTQLGADGFVFGILNEDRSVHKEACKTLVNVAGGKPCTFHRAFDETDDPFAALDGIKECGFARILTSGHHPTVSEGLHMLTKLLLQAGSEITIMPGGGLQPQHIKQLNRDGLLREIHASCRQKNRSTEKVKDSVSSINKQLIDQFKKETDDIRKGRV